MFNKKKKIYTLNDIEKLFTYIPTIFILLLAIVAIIISFFILDFKQKRDVDLLKQELTLNYQFNKKDQLHAFADDVEKKVNAELSLVKTELVEIIYKTMGNIDSKYEQHLNLNDLALYLNKVEKTRGVEFVLFEKKDLHILYGHKAITNLEQLMFNHANYLKYQKLTLQYIASQGKNNLQYWRYDLQKNLIMSFFDTFKIQDDEYFIGVFSTINNLKQLTKEIIIDSIKELKQEFDYDVWFYDSNTKQTFNFQNKHIMINVDDIANRNNLDRKTKILNYYETNDDENKKFRRFVYLYSKYAFLISIDYDSKSILKSKQEQIKTIINEYRDLFLRISMYIIIITALLILSTFVFSNFIKNVFDKYYRELRRKTDSLEHWKKRFELAIIASNDGLWDIDFKSDKIYFSKKWLSMFGYEKGDLVNFNDWVNLIHQDDKKKVERTFDEILSGKSDSFIGEYRLKTKDNHYKWVFARGKIFKDENLDSKRMLMMSMDIDKNKKMIKELLEVELLVEDGRIVIFKWEKDKNLSVKYVSNSIKSFGYSKEEFEIHKINFLDIIHEDDKSSLLNMIDEAVEKELKSFSKVFRIINTENEIKWVFCRTLLLKDDFGNVTQLYGYINDVTKIKVSEEDLKVKVKEEVEKNRKKDRLLIQQSKLAAMGEMLGNIAHQWRQPLNNVNLILHFLRDNYQNKNFTREKLEKYITKSKTQIDYMSQTIDDFSKFYKPSKIQNDFNVQQAIKDVLKISKEQFINDEIKVIFESKDIIIMNYENELKQSLLNILNNAKDAILKKRGQKQFSAFVKIKVVKKSKFAKITIENNGGNIDEDIIERIFEPYFTTKFETQGTGIGLYMTKTIIETNMKGEIKAENIKDGVRFEIKLPLKTVLN